MLEIGAALAKIAYRPAAVKMIAALRNDPTVDIIAIDRHLFDAAFGLFTQRGIKQALAANEHFAQAGLVPLLLDR